MSVDFRREWLKKKTLDFMGLQDEEYFDHMSAANKDFEEHLASFLDDEILRDEDREILYIFKSFQEKLIEEETMVPYTGNIVKNFIYIFFCFVTFIIYCAIRSLWYYFLTVLRLYSFTIKNIQV